MGNSASSHRERPENHVDFGSFKPFGTYSGPQDWNHEVVAQLIKDRKIAPFYWPLEDYEDDYTDEQIMAARKIPAAEASSPSATSDAGSDVLSSTPSRSSMSTRQSERSGRRDMRIPEAQLYNGAVECPICFLYYPPNINRSRCCDHYICTECFVQIKRADPTPQHLVSEPAACPYCVQDNFGIIYTPPPWRSGIGSEGYPSPELYKVTSAGSINAPPPPLAKQRRKSVSHTSPEVVTVDQIRPDWEAKLAAVRAAVARRANRRIIMRQVGDRLIPVGITSGRVQINPDGAEGGPIVETGDEGSRGTRRRRAHELSQLLGSMGMAGQDLEELMVMEAMRLSLLEHEQAQRRQQEQEARQGATGGASSSTARPPLSSSVPVSGSRTPIAVPMSRGAGQPAEAVIASSLPHAHRLSGSASLSPPHRNGSPLRPSGATPPSTSSPRRPDSGILDPAAGPSAHQAAVAAANTFLSPPPVPTEETTSSSIAPNIAPELQAPIPLSAELASTASLIAESSVPPAPRTPLGVRTYTTDSVRTDMSEDGGGTYEPLASPDAEESVRLLDEAMHENMELPHRGDTATPIARQSL